ncbi:type II toxin-antitoxin system RelE/ParE family toxin [Belliella pelovolcani]|uniref:Toxin ParE1/3/4 n=1 Tax=Belliella pelovolcani TaxID=529505 RepID=A0A1N7K1J5_9BACT|nr:type II toxin-antitoxin system RelE/ParE family toxin [Belliella pelovolcani]SIS55460.1 toxin ParE1/3/4 [Belliella pelovolcani]
MGKYFLTAKALSDLSDIYEYTYYFWSENQADKYYQNLIDCFQSLAKNPKNWKSV